MATGILSVFSTDDTIIVALIVPLFVQLHSAARLLSAAIAQDPITAAGYTAKRRSPWAA